MRPTAAMPRSVHKRPGLYRAAGLPVLRREEKDLRLNTHGTDIKPWEPEAAANTKREVSPNAH